MESLRRQWNEACLQTGIPALTLPTCARIMAILMHYGNNEALVLSPHFRADCEYVQKRYHMQDGEVPDPEFAAELRAVDLELQQRSCYAPPPEWAVKLMMEMYNIKI